MRMNFSNPRLNLKLLFCFAVGLTASAQSSFTINTFAGNGTSGFSGDGGLATSAQINGDNYGIATDSGGNVYFGDYDTCRVRKVDSNGIISTIAGTGVCSSTGDGGLAVNATLDYPVAVARDSAGNIYVGEDGSARVRRIDTSGHISTIAGTGTYGFSGDGGPATSASIRNIYGIAADSAGNIYLSDAGNSRIRKVDTSGMISTVAGGGGSLGDGGPATSASLAAPFGITVDPSGNLYICDQGHFRIRKVDTTGVISTVAGTGTSGFSGDGGAATSAAIGYMFGVVADAVGNLYMGGLDSRIRRVNSAGVIETVAGTGTSGFSGNGGPATSAQIGGDVYSLAAAPNGNVYFADSDHSVIRVLSAGRITQLPSTNLGSTSALTTVSLGQATGLGTTATLVYGTEFAVNTSGCTYSGTVTFQAACPVTFTPQKIGLRRDALRVTDSNGNLVGVQYLYGIGQGPLAAITPGTISTLNLGSLTNISPTEFTFDPAGNLYWVEYPSGRIVKMTPQGVFSEVTISGLSGALPLNLAAGWDGSLYAVDSTGRLLKIASDASFTVMASNLNFGSLVGQMVMGLDGTFYVCGIANNNIYKISADGASSVAVSISSTLSQPGGLALDPAGNLYVSNQGNGTIVKVRANGTSSVLTPSTTIQTPAGLWSDASGNLYVVDAGANKLFRLAADGTATVVAGTGAAGSAGDGGPATSATISPVLVASDADGNVYLSDSTNHVIRRITLPASLPFANTLVGSSSSINAQITNVGNQAYTFPSAFTFAASRTPFNVTSGGSGDCSSLLNGSFAAGASCSLTIQFTPPAASSFSDTLTVTTGILLPLSGVAALPPTGIPSVNPAPLNFGNIGNGSTATAQTVTISNSGTGTLNFTSAVLSGPDASEFSTSNNCASTVAPNAQCTVSVTFHPTTAGAKAATLTITDADATALTPITQVITLTGTGVTPFGQASLSASALSFPTQAPGTTTVPQAVTLTNAGTGALAITSVNLTGTDASQFSITNNCGSSLAVRSNCSVQVAFAPTSEGQRTANLVFTFNTGQNTTSSTVTLSGIGSAVTFAVPMGAFTIVSVRSGKALDVTGASTLNGALLQQYDFASSTNQIWQAIPIDSTFYQIRSIGTGKVLDARNAGAANGTLVQQWNYLGGDQQKWQFVPQSDGSVEIVNKINNKALDVFGASTQNQATIQLWDYNATDNQKWQITAVTLPTPTPQYYTISSLATGKVLDVVSASTADQARIQQYDFVYGANQEWQLTPTSDGFYQIVNRLSGKVLDGLNFGTAEGIEVQQYAYSGNESQQWELLPTANGYYQVLNRLTGKLLEVRGQSSSNGALLQTSTYAGRSSQQFAITPVDNAATFTPQRVQFYTISSLASGKVLDVVSASTADQARVQQYDYLSGPNQQWQLVPTTNGYYKIMNRLSGKVLDGENAGKGDAVPVQQYTYVGLDNQQWQLISTSNDSFQIVNKLSGKSLDVTGASSFNGALLQLYTYRGGLNQQFAMTPITTR
jgi:sugar lactone lactonase YvrE